MGFKPGSSDLDELTLTGDLDLTGSLDIGASADGTDRTIVLGHNTLKTIIGIDDSADAFIINTGESFESSLANNSFSIDTSNNIIIAGDLRVGGADLTGGTDGHFNLRSDASMFFKIDVDEDQSGQYFGWEHDSGTEIMKLTQDGNLQIDGDFEATGGDIVLGNADAAGSTIMHIDATAGQTGRNLTIGASDVTPGSGTADRAGGDITIRGGKGTGTASGGSIIFRTSAAGVSSGTAATQGYATALTIPGNKIITVANGITVGTVEAFAGSHGGTQALATTGVSFINTSDTTDRNYSLADGEVIGQVKEIRMLVYGGNDPSANGRAIVTVATDGWSGSTVTFNAVGDYIKLIWANPTGAGAAWYPIQTDSTVLA